MSQFNDLNAYALDSHNWFFPKGSAITSPGVGVVSINNWPDTNEPTFDDRFIGDTEEWSHKKNVESEEVFKPVGGVLVRKQIVDFFQSLDFEITTNSLRRIAMQIMYGADVDLDADTGAFAPLKRFAPEGLWVSQKYTQEGERVFLANLWCKVDLTETASGNKKLIKPKFMVKMLDSDLNYMFFGDPDLLA